MKRLIYLLSFILVLSCKKENKNIKINYYPSELSFKNQKLIEFVEKDSNTDFKDLINFIVNSYANNIKPYITISNQEDKTIDKVLFIRHDWGYYDSRNFITITKDSILKNGKHPMSELPRLLEKHYLNTYKDSRYPNDASKAYVLIALEIEDDIEILKMLVKKLISGFDSFNKVNDNIFELKIGLSSEKFIPPPPLINPPAKTSSSSDHN